MSSFLSFNVSNTAKQWIKSILDYSFDSSIDYESCLLKKSLKD